MSIWLKQSTAVTIPLGPFVDETDGKTAETALSIAQADVRLSKNGGAFAQKGETSASSHMENGYYAVALNTTDTGTLGHLRIHVHESGALPVWVDCMVVPANVWDSLFGADKLQVHADEITAGLITAAAIATGAIDADAIAADAVTEIQSGLATAAALQTVDDFVDDLESRLTAARATALDNLDATISSRATPAQVNTEVDTALADARLDELLAADSDIDGLAPPAVGSVFHELMTKTAGSFTYDQATDSLEAIRDKEADIEADTQDIQGRLPAALVAGRMSSDAVAISGSTAAADAVEANIGNLDAAITTRATQASVDTVDDFVDELETRLTAGRATNLDNLDALVSSRATPAQVNAEVVDAINTDAYGEPGQGAPPVNTSLVAKINYLYKAFRNKITQTATTQSIFGDDGSTVDHKSTVSDDGTTFTRGEFVSGP